MYHQGVREDFHWGHTPSLVYAHALLPSSLLASLDSGGPPVRACPIQSWTQLTAFSQTDPVHVTKTSLLALKLVAVPWIFKTCSSLLHEMYSSLFFFGTRSTMQHCCSNFQLPKPSITLGSFQVSYSVHYWEDQDTLSMRKKLGHFMGGVGFLVKQELKFSLHINFPLMFNSSLF